MKKESLPFLSNTELTYHFGESVITIPKYEGTIRRKCYLHDIFFGSFSSEENELYNGPFLADTIMKSFFYIAGIDYLDELLDNIKTAELAKNIQNAKQLSLLRINAHGGFLDSWLVGDCIEEATPIELLLTNVNNFILSRGITVDIGFLYICNNGYCTLKTNPLNMPVFYRQGVVSYIYGDKEKDKSKFIN